MRITFEVDEQVAHDFEEIRDKLNEKYSDEPFDENAFIESKMKEFNKNQKKFLGVMAYNEA